MADNQDFSVPPVADQPPTPQAAPGAVMPPPPPPPVSMPMMFGAGPPKKTFISRVKDALVLITFLGSLLLNVVLLLALGAGRMDADFSEKVLLDGADDQRIGVIQVEGVITGRMVAQLSPQFDEVRKNDRYKALLLWVDSPGGGVGASDTIAHYVQRIRQADKKVVVFMGDVAASGGYYVSAGADYIMAGATTITGSIGVIAQLPNIHGTLEKIGAHMVVIPSTPATKKAIGSPFVPWDPANRDYFQKLLDSAHERFVQVIHAGRKKHFPDRAKLEKLANGEVLTSAQAKAAKLIDRDGAYFEDAQKKAAELAGLSNPKVVKLARVKSLAESLRGAQSKTALINIEASLMNELTRPRLLYLWQGQ